MNRLAAASSPDSTIGATIRTARLSRWWSQRRLALELAKVARAEGITLPKIESLVTMISRWENGKIMPGDFYLLLLAKTLLINF